MSDNRFLTWWTAISCCTVVAIAVAAFSNVPAAADQRRAARGTTAARKALRPGDVDVSTSQAYIYVGKTGFGHEHAVIGRVKEGEIRLGATKDAGKLVFDMTTFTADTEDARNYIGLKGSTSASTQQQVNANMLGKDVLNVKKYPTATFEIASAVPLKQKSRNGNPRYQLSGEFTLHGVKRALKLNAEAQEKKGYMHLSGGFAILQSSFGITPFSKAFGTIGVADKLVIYGEIDVATDQVAAERSTSRR